jgi:nitrogen regulatory protein PII-like uncharacterized protein
MVIQLIIWLVLTFFAGLIIYVGYKKWNSVAMKDKEEAVNKKISDIEREAKLLAKISVYDKNDLKEREETLKEFLDQEPDQK